MTSRHAKWACGTLVFYFLSLCGVEAAESEVLSPAQPARSASDSVVTLSTVTARAADGRVERFSDARRRTFLVTYDVTGMVYSVRSPDRRNRADILEAQYTADGRMVTARLGDGNLLVFSYDPDGTQYVRDRYGVVVQRVPTQLGYSVAYESDPSASLRAMVERLDTLFKSLASKDSR